MFGPENDEEEVIVDIDSEGNPAEIVSLEDLIEEEDDEYDSQKDYENVEEDEYDV